MKKVIPLILFTSALVLSACASHHHTRLDFARLDPLLFDIGGQFRTFYA